MRKVKTDAELFAGFNDRDFAEFRKTADERRKTHKHWSARACIDRMRWERDQRGQPDIKVSNDLTPILGRKYNALVGEDFFTTNPAACDETIKNR